jgi:tetratricopeptide (TPR) repeat protein
MPQNNETAASPSQSSGLPGALRARFVTPAGRRAASAIVLVTFVLLFVGLRASSLTKKSATWDEPVHLTAGYLALHDGDYRVDPSHPPFMRMWAALPLLLMDSVHADVTAIDSATDDGWLRESPHYSSQFLYSRHDADQRLQAARFMIVFWGVALGILVFCWAREWLGFTPAVIALAAFTLEPNIAAHARLVTTDLGITFFIFATIYCLWRSCRRPSAANVAMLAVCFALAFVTKFSAILLVPIVGLLLLLATLLRMPIGRRRSMAVAVLLAVSTVAAVWASYGFRYDPSDSRGWRLHLQDAPLVVENAPTLARFVTWVDERHLLPNAFVQGFLMNQASSVQTAYLAGDYSEDGWWYYFPIAFVVKTPLVLVLLSLAGGILLVLRRERFGIANVAFVGLPVLLYLGFAMASGINIGIRHILPIYPFVLLIAAAAAHALVRCRRPIGGIALVALMAFWCAMFVRVYPHTLTFFNVLAGGPEGGLAYLSDSNLDWGQDLKLLKSWMARKDVDTLNLAYFGTADPGYYGITSTYLPGTAALTMLEKPKLPGYVAISATILSGVYLTPEWRLFYEGFERLTPVDRIGNSIYVYWIDHWPEPDPATADDRPAPGGSHLEASLANDLFFGMAWSEHAIVHYRNAVDASPNDPRLLADFGLALLESGDRRSAISTFQRAVAVDPQNGQTRYRLAASLLEDGQVAEATIEAEAAVRLRPDDASARDLLGVALAMSGRTDAAVAALDKALQLAPNDRTIRGHLERARASVAKS